MNVKAYFQNSKCVHAQQLVVDMLIIYMMMSMPFHNIDTPDHKNPLAELKTRDFSNCTGTRFST